jgi:ABC-type transport system involved in multi-copper enzyme maturation permease subunit
MTTLTPARPAAGQDRDSFARLLHAEWTKFRTVRGWLAAVLVAGLLTAALGLLNNSSCSVGRIVGGQQIISACPGAPLGPDGSAVTDSFYFVHQPLAGDGTITVRVAALTGKYPPSGGNGQGAAPGQQAPDQGDRGTLAGYVPGLQPWAKAGLMIKSSATAGAAYAAMTVTGANGVRMQSDFTGDTAGLPGPVTAASPRWLRLTRSGSTVTGYDSPDGAHWTQVGRVTLAGLPSAAQVGLFSTSPGYTVTTQSLGGGSSTGGPTLATASFDHLATSWRAGGWTGTAVAGGPGGAGAAAGGPEAGSGPDPFGNYQRSGGTFTVSGSGDIAPDVPDSADGVGTNLSSILNAGTFFGLIVLVVLGAVFVTAEYRRGLIRMTFTASPRRGRVLAAKAVVLGAVAFVTGLIGTAIALPLGEAQIRRGGNWIPPMPTLTSVRMIVGVAAVMALAAVLALALGVILRRGVAAVSAAIVLIALPFLFAVIPGLFPVGAEGWLLRVFPAAALAMQQVIPAYHQVTAQYTPSNGYYPLTWWAGFLVLCAWTAVALAAAACLLKRRDA